MMPQRRVSLNAISNFTGNNLILPVLSPKMLSLSQATKIIPRSSFSPRVFVDTAPVSPKVARSNNGTPIRRTNSIREMINAAISSPPPPPPRILNETTQTEKFFITTPTIPQPQKRPSIGGDSSVISKAYNIHKDDMDKSIASTKKCQFSTPPAAVRKPTIQRNHSISRITPIDPSTVKVTTPIMSKPQRRPPMVGCEDDLVSIASYYTASTTTRPGLERNNSLSRITPLDPSTVKVVVPTKPQRRSAKADSNAASVSSYDNGDSITIATSSTKSSHCTSAEPPMRPTLQRNSSLARITPIASSTVKVTTPTTSKPHRRTSISGGESVCTYKYDRDQEDAQSVASKRPTVQRNPSFSRITPIDSSAVKVTIPIQMTATPKRRPSIGSTSSLLCSAPSASNTPTCCVACKEKDDEQNKLVVENEQLKAQVQQLKQLLASVTKQQRAL